MVKKAVNLMSGGIDSTVLSAWLKDKGYDVVGVFFDYGQENLEPTLKSAKYFAKKLDIELLTLKVPYNWSKSSVIKGNFKREGITEENVYKKNVKEMSWVPARNAVFMLLAGGIASERNIEEVYISFQYDKPEWKLYDSLRDKSKFPASDLTPDFVEAMNEVAKYSYKTPIKFKAPFLDERLDAKEIVDIGRALGLELEKTYSCRYYINGGPCGECEQCIIRKRRLG